MASQDSSSSMISNDAPETLDASQANGQLIFDPQHKPGTDITTSVYNPCEVALMKPEDHKKFLAHVTEGGHLGAEDAKRILALAGPTVGRQISTAIIQKVKMQKQAGLKPEPVFLPLSDPATQYNPDTTGFMVDYQKLPFNCDSLPVPREFMRMAGIAHASQINMSLTLVEMMPIPVHVNSFLHVLLQEMLPIVWDSYHYIRHLMMIWYMWQDDKSGVSIQTHEKLQRLHIQRMEKISQAWETTFSQFQQTLTAWQKENSLPASAVPDFLLYQLELSMYSHQLNFIMQWELSVIAYYLKENQPEMVMASRLNQEKQVYEGILVRRNEDSYVPGSYVRQMLVSPTVLPVMSTDVPEFVRKDIEEDTTGVMNARSTFYGTPLEAIPSYISTEHGNGLVSRIGSFKLLRQFYYFLAEAPAPTDAPPVRKELDKFLAAQAAELPPLTAETGQMISVAESAIPSMESATDPSLPDGSVTAMDE